MKTRAWVTLLGLVSVAVVVVIGGVPLPSLAAETDDVEQVREAVFNYFKGASGSDLALMEKAWDKPNAHMKYISKNDQGVDEVQVIPIAEMFERWSKKSSPGAKGSVLSMDIVDGRMAVVKFEFVTTDKVYIDYLSLYKINGEWKIVNKIFIIE